MRIEAAWAEKTVTAGAGAARATDLKRCVALRATTLPGRSKLVGAERHLIGAEGVRKRIPRGGRAAGDVGREAAALEVDVRLPRVAQKPSGDLRAPVELRADEVIGGPQRLPRPVIDVAAAAVDALRPCLRKEAARISGHEAPAVAGEVLHTLAIVHR